MNKKKLHGTIVIILIIYAIITYYRVDPESKFGVMQWFPVFLITGIYVGIVFVVYILPNLVHSATNSVLGSNEKVEKDPRHDARAAEARGDYTEAAEIYNKLLTNSPEDEKSWLALVMIQQKKLHSPESAIKTLEKALLHDDWPEDSKAFFMSRRADIYLNDLDNQIEAATLLQQIIETFPNTRHSANATHKLDGIASAT